MDTGFLTIAALWGVLFIAVTWFMANKAHRDTPRASNGRFVKKGAE